MRGGLRVPSRRACEATPTWLPCGNFRCPVATGRSVWFAEQVLGSFLIIPEVARLSQGKSYQTKRSYYRCVLAFGPKPGGCLFAPWPGCHCRPPGDNLSGAAHQDDDRSSVPPARGSANATTIGSVDPYALELGGMLIHGKLCPPARNGATHRHRAFAVWLPLAPPKWLPPPPPLTHGHLMSGEARIEGPTTMRLTIRKALSSASTVLTGPTHQGSLAS
jgi:hypothetical protein